MQTFLPLADMKASVEVLDYRRLGKQRVEALQLINAIGGYSTGWQRHPAAHMWSRHIYALMKYHDLCIMEWVRRGYMNTMTLFNPRVYEMPEWFGDEAFHSTHRAALLFKDPDHYRRFDWREEPKIAYLWPTYHNQVEMADD